MNFTISGFQKANISCVFFSFAQHDINSSLTPFLFSVGETILRLSNSRIIPITLCLEDIDHISALRVLLSLINN